MEQLSEFHSQPTPCESPILGAILGATLGIGGRPKNSIGILRVFFEIGVFPRTRRIGYKKEKGIRLSGRARDGVPGATSFVSLELIRCSGDSPSVRRPPT